jgi:chitinase
MFGRDPFRPRKSARRPSAPVRLTVAALEDRRTPAAMLSIDDATVLEGNAGTQNAVVTVRLTEPHGNSVTVNYRTADGSALAGTDYSAVSGKLTFARNEMSKSVLVPIRGNRTVDPDRDFSVQLSNPKGAKIARGQGTVTILDDEPRVNIDDAWQSEGNDGDTAMTFNLTLSRAYDRPVTVNYTTVDQAATAGDDYTATSGSWTFQPGDTSHPITVMVKGDRVAEPNEAFAVQIDTADSYARVVKGTGVGTIYDDEPRIYISDVYSEGGDTFTFTVSLSNPYDQPVTVHFETADGTAIAGTDYNPTSGTLTFDGTTSLTITVTAIDPTVSGKYFFVSLSGASSNAMIATPSAVGYFDYSYYYDPGYYYDSGYYYDPYYGYW